MSKKVSSEGFSIIETIVVVLIVALLGISGWFIWRHNHQQKKTATTAGSNSTSTQQTQAPDPYAGWKSYCDNYHYCFKYPADWTLTVQTAAQQTCEAGQITLSNPGNTVELTYQNANNHDGALASYMPTVPSTLLSAANQALSLIGGYSRLGNSYYPAYDMVDPSLLTTYPLTVGQETHIPQPSEFTDQGTGAKHCSGSFESVPSKPLSNSTDAEAWFNTSDAQTGLQIMKSFHYKD